MNSASSNEQLNLELPDDRQMQVPFGTTPETLLADLTEKDTKGAIGVLLDGEIYDLQTPLTTSGTLEIIKLKDDSEAARHIYRHSFSHIMAQAVLRLYPEAKLAIGPATEQGFYYDFDLPHSFSPEDLEKISAEMEKVITENLPFRRIELSADEALAKFESSNATYKIELINEIAERGDSVTMYEDGEFVDLCRGPHLPSTGWVKHFQLLELAGAYWRGSELNRMLQRIYGTAFLNKKDLKNYLWEMEEARKRDHRKLGKELDLFSSLPDQIGSGLILWHPKGGLIRHLIEAHCKARHLASGYEFVVSPHVGRATLWETSGHLDFYREGMFPAMELEGQEFYMKPMNCPFHVHIFKNQVRSYRDMPMRFAEWGTVYRFERSGAVHGLTRARGFTQDDAHLFCRPDQMPAEIDKVLAFSVSILKDFGLEQLKLYLSTRPEKRVGKESDWDAAETALEDALKRSGLPYEVNVADGAFYGPKIDICVFDAIGREWQLSTIQFDFNLPERFDLAFIGEDGKEHRPFMIHRALLGSMERFFGIIIEHYGGAFPLWLAPVQAVVLPIAERHHEYAQKVVEQLTSTGVRAEIDGSSNTLGYRIRHAQMQKVPFMLVVGDKEVEGEKVAVRTRGGDDLGAKALNEFMDSIDNERRSPSERR